MKELPQGWVETKFGELLELKYGKALPDKVRDGHGFPVFGSNGIVGNHSVPLTNSETLIVGRKGSVGEVQYSAGPCSPIDTTYYVDCLWGMPFLFWLYYLRHLRLQDFNKATAVPGLSRADAYRLPIHVAPLNEQKRIADKLDSLLARVDDCRERLDRVPQILKHFRQAVLAAAIKGALTEEWRKSAGNLDHWRTVTLAQVAKSRLGKMLDKAKNQGNPTPYLRNINVRWFQFDLSDILEIKVTEKETQTFAIRSGDVLVCEGGEPGRCAVWRGVEDVYVYQKALHRVRVCGELIPEWLCYCFKSAADSGSLSNLFTGSTIKHLTGIALAQFEFKLPSIAEQHEIVRRVETLFVLAERLEARYIAGREQIDQLISSLLDKAFCGELLPQDPNDEPASELLKRIKELKTNEPALKPKPRVNTIKTGRHMNTKAITTLDELVSVLDQLDGDAMADRLVMESGLSDDIDRFFELLREGRNTLLEVPVGSNSPIRRIVDANQ